MTRGQKSSHSDYASTGSFTKPLDLPADTDLSSKKRKRDEHAATATASASDPKLREFLTVMKAGREGVLDDAVNASLGGGEAANAPTVAPPEEASDDEYEQIPARKEKQRRLDSSDKVQPTISRQPESRDMDTTSNMQASTGSTPAAAETAELTESAKADLQQPSAVATDDDWMRSRTNRLLDLVDPDDLERTPAQGQPLQETGHSEGGNLVENSSANAPSADRMAEKSITTELTGGEPVKEENSLDLIRRTSRLFVRNLPYSASGDDLRESFQRFGTIEEVC